MEEKGVKWWLLATVSQNLKSKYSHCFLQHIDTKIMPVRQIMWSNFLFAFTWYYLCLPLSICRKPKNQKQNHLTYMLQWITETVYVKTWEKA